ncbi:DUF1152 domain-containing protein [Nocardia tengchongensis]|uniref:DUF1152 domain-containing protein n=1 Tax=Nocardia tengchongensis TaxID=2055889 RepID=A0ABX8CJF5_9NOCA|nr:DUF1152 domain-containing protein [Nocardia tengchongensis]QVI20104.1 DUF1152 domain-containing protein [Nocardia tengchongensis]
MHTAIAIAAGGGGDAITAAVLAAAMPELRINAIMSFSWDRFMIDPTPGPRIRTDFEGWVDRGGVAEITSRSRLRTGHSTLPSLSVRIGLPLLLLEADQGAVGLARTITLAANEFGADQLVVVDVGGDILAEGHEPELRTPLADSLTLAAAVQTGIDTRVLVAALGLDGELSPIELRPRLDRLNAFVLRELGAADVMPFDDVWTWHPSEASGMLATAAKGWRGAVETQRNALIHISGDASLVYEVDAPKLADTSLAASVATTTSLDQAEQVLRECRSGLSELDIERRRAAGEHAKALTPTLKSLRIVDDYAAQARGRGADALTIRRVAELLSAIDPSAGDILRRLLARHRPDQFRPPLYTTTSGRTI